MKIPILMQFLSATDLLELTAPQNVLVMTINVPATGQKIWIQATAK